MKESNNNLICDAVSEDIINITEHLVMKYGTKEITVRSVLKEMNVTNRVFYNRFRNIDEVLEIIYRRTVLKMRESLTSEIDLREDFFGYVMDVCVKILSMTYDLKNQFSQYMFEFDSSTDSNRLWWFDKIKEIIRVGKETNQLKDVDEEKLSYTVWCFIRAFGADAIKRKMSKEQAQSCFCFGFGALLDGLKV